VTRPRQIKDRIAALGEIGEILGAMKNLALMELQKLHRLIDTQSQTLQTIEAAAADLSASYLREPRQHAYFDVELIVGTERGFCGDLNETLIAAEREGADKAEQVLVVGSRLADRFADQFNGQGVDAVSVAGASVAEEVEQVLASVLGALDTLQRDSGGGRLLRLTACYHDDEIGAVRRQRLTPLPELPPPSPKFSYPPILDLAPIDVFSKVLDQYLYAMLHAVLYGSLRAENQRRLVHMENALHHIDEDRARLRLRYNALRQEEITEEIEVILLSAEAISASV
jgi:F-type H+-transporting ATPase subunit gamma